MTGWNVRIVHLLGGPDRAPEPGMSILAVRNGHDTTPAQLLKSSTHRRDALRVEAQPVHPPDVSRMFDLHAAIHDDRQTARLGNTGGFLVDHAELAPDGPGVDGNCLLGNGGERLRRTEDID